MPRAVTLDAAIGMSKWAVLVAVRRPGELGLIRRGRVPRCGGPDRAAHITGDSDRIIRRWPERDWRGGDWRRSEATDSRHCNLPNAVAIQPLRREQGCQNCQLYSVQFGVAATCLPRYCLGNGLGSQATRSMGVKSPASTPSQGEASACFISGARIAPSRDSSISAIRGSRLA